MEGALTATVTTAQETERLLVEGQARRAVAGTNMNDASSRSHAIFTIVVTKVELDLKTGAEGFATSKVMNRGTNLNSPRSACKAWGLKSAPTCRKRARACYAGNY